MFGNVDDAEMEQNVSTDLSQGYSFRVYALPGNQFAIGEPEPLEDEPRPGDIIDSPADLLKHVLAIIKDTPVQPSEQSGFDESESDTQAKQQIY